MSYHHFIGNSLESKNFYRENAIKAVDMVVEFLEGRDTPFTGITPHEIRKKVDDCSLDFCKVLTVQEALDELVEIYLNDTTNFHSTKYVAHLNFPVLAPALVAEIISSALDTSMDTWDQSIGATIIEQNLIKWISNSMGYQKDADGIFTSGGTQSNLMGLLLARDDYIIRNYNINPKTSGLPADAGGFKIFCSEVSHFSLKKNACLLGLGQNSIVPVKVDDTYRIDCLELDKSILACKKKGDIPIAVIATAGTTDFGSIDSLIQIKDLSKKHSLWFHVDAAYGGGLILSEKHRDKLKGIEFSDSMTVDFHKMYFQPVACSGFLVKDSKYFEYISYYADYLNPKEQECDETPNMVKKSIQTTRRFDALKLWLTLKITGKEKLGIFVDDICKLASDTVDLMCDDNDIEVLNEQPEISTIVFRFNPTNYNLPKEEISPLNTYIKKTIFEEGKAFVASTKYNGEIYLKFTLTNPLSIIEHIREIIALIKYHGENWCKRRNLKHEQNI